MEQNIQGPRDTEKEKGDDREEKENGDNASVTLKSTKRPKHIFEGLPLLATMAMECEKNRRHRGHGHKGPVHGQVL